MRFAEYRSLCWPKIERILHRSVFNDGYFPIHDGPVSADMFQRTLAFVNKHHQNKNERILSERDKTAHERTALDRTSRVECARRRNITVTKWYPAKYPATKQYTSSKRHSDARVKYNTAERQNSTLIKQHECSWWRILNDPSAAMSFIVSPTSGR